MINRLDKAGLLRSIKFFAGTSAGAVIAALCAVGNKPLLANVHNESMWSEMVYFWDRYLKLQFGSIMFAPKLSKIRKKHTDVDVKHNDCNDK